MRFHVERWTEPKLTGISCDEPMKKVNDDCKYRHQHKDTEKRPTHITLCWHPEDVIGDILIKDRIAGRRCEKRFLPRFYLNRRIQTDGVTQNCFNPRVLICSVHLNAYLIPDSYIFCLEFELRDRNFGRVEAFFHDNRGSSTESEILGIGVAQVDLPPIAGGVPHHDTKKDREQCKPTVN